VSGPEANQQTAEEAVETVADFRETASRLEPLEELAAIDDVDMGGSLQPVVLRNGSENQDEWLDALDDLFESAFEAYAADGSEPVEAHLYDLFEYYDDRVGSTHYASNGILTGDDVLLREVRRRRTVPDRGHRGVGAPASPLRVSHWPRFVREARERGLRNPVIPSRVTFLPTGRIEALSEITTSGYRPNRKHGVEINIRPLAEAKIVPKTVEDDVL